MSKQNVIAHSEESCNYLFTKGKMLFLLDGYAAGSAGKGKLESFVIKHSNNCNFIVTTNSANASHIVWDEGREMMFKCLPSSAYMHEKLDAIYLTAGSVFEVKTLLHEIEMCGIPRSKVRINPKAGIIQKIDIDFEKGLCDLDGNYFPEMGEGTIKGGSTCSGSGAVRAKKCLRHKTLVFASDIPEFKDMICETEIEIMERLGKEECGMMQIGQGFPLSYGLANTKKNSTARNVTIAAALDDAMLPPYVVSDVLMNGRVFPIKIANYKNLSVGEQLYKQIKGGSIIKEDYPEHLFKVVMSASGIDVWTKPNVFVSGDDLDKFPDYPYKKIDSYSGDFYPDQKEISWEEVEAQYGKEIPDEIKRTSLTKLPRRCATFSKLLLEDGIIYNLPPDPYNIYISINFMNWIDGNMDDNKDQISEKQQQWLEENIYPVIGIYPNVGLAFLGTGKESDSMVQLRVFEENLEYLYGENNQDGM